MKFVVSLAAFVSAAMAATTNIPAFTLKAVAPGLPFDGMPLQISGSIVGLNYTDSEDLRFYATGSDDTWGWTLHRYPIGIIDHPGILAGESAYHFAFMPNPETNSKDLGSRLMMDNWTFSVGRPMIKIVPAEGKFLGFNSEQRWYAFPGAAEGQWNIMWWDGSCCVAAVGMPLKLQLVAAKPDMRA
ncbi:hypothetical protein ABW19_dt0205648 [Dactylella cylindrospora]|nr:hypothetical protein ABW19_dt0205648 [Dactylella cylindrospora]